MIIANSMRYVLDSDSFIRAARTHYSFDFAKPFWDGLLKYADLGFICSIDRVQDELIEGNDELSKWAKNSFSKYFLETDKSEILTNYTKIINWAQNQNQYNQRAKDEFYEIDNADPWIISFADTYKLTIVTHEVFDTNIKKKIPIPNVCKAFGINYIDIYQMLRELNFNF